MNRETIALISASAGLAAVALAVALSAHRRLAVARRSLAVLQGSSNGKTLLDVVATYGKDLELFEDGLNKIIERQDDLYAHLASSVRNIAVVRYDAFEDMGGRLSFSVALLNDNSDGIVITSINGRQDTRCYAKQVQRGTSIHNLSDEEEQAIREAMSGRREVAPTR